MTMQTALTENGRRDFLKGLGLSADAPGLAPVVESKAKAKKDKATKEVQTVVETVNPRTIPASEIVFDPAMLDDFADLSGSGMAAASRHLFEHYKSPGKDRERNGLLHRRIGEFIQQTRRARQQLVEPTGHVKQKVKQTKEQRDLAAMLAAAGLTADDLARLIEERK
jgi:hypothetical protein